MLHGTCEGCGRHTWLNKDYICNTCEKDQPIKIEINPNEMLKGLVEKHKTPTGEDAYRMLAEEILNLKNELYFYKESERRGLFTWNVDKLKEESK